MQKLLVIAGCTAVGKSAFALELSKFLNMEIVSADSIQIYKGIEIATSKPTKLEQEQCKHHLVDIISPFDNSFNLYKYITLAKECISEISSRGKLPVVVGGTGLYIDGLIHDFDFTTTKKNKLYDVKYIFLNDDRETIYKKINLRVNLWIQKGLVDEVKTLRQIGLTKDFQCMQAIGYSEVCDYLEGNIPTLEQTIDLIKQNTRHYAKRQLTWFNHRDCEKLDIKNSPQITDDLLEYYKEYKK